MQKKRHQKVPCLNDSSFFLNSLLVVWNSVLREDSATMSHESKFDGSKIIPYGKGLTKTAHSVGRSSDDENKFICSQAAGLFRQSWLSLPSGHAILMRRFVVD